MCMAESLHCSPETITRLLISYTPIQNKKLKKKEIETVKRVFQVKEAPTIKIKKKDLGCAERGSLNGG